MLRFSTPLYALGILSTALILAAGCSTTENTNRPPVAVAGNDQRAFVGDAVSLDGNASFDPDADSLSYEWRVLSAPSASVLVPDAAVVDADATYDFTPDVPGGFVLALTVLDEDTSSTDVVAVDVSNVLNVTATIPADGALDVALRTPVVIFFSEPIRPWTAAAAFLVEDVTDLMNPVPVLGTIALDDGDTSLVFIPSTDWAATEYRITVTTAAMGLDGAPLRSEVTSDFSGALVDNTPPTILAVSPADAALDQPIHTIVEILFSEPVDTTAATAAFTLTGLAVEDGALTFSAGDTKATFIPANTAPDPDVPQVLAADTDYTVDIAATVTDVAAIPNALSSAFVSTFRTELSDSSGAPQIVSVSPFPGAGGVSVKLPTAVTFSEPVAPATVNATTFQLSGGAAVTGTIQMALGNSVAIFVPDVNLETSTRYDVAVTAGVTDLSSTALDGDGDGSAGGDYSAFFTTGLAPPPTVYTASPLSVPQIDTTLTLDVTGEDFVDGATTVLLGGGVLVNSTTFVSDTALQVEITISPAATLGFRSLTVTNPDGQSGTGFNLLDILDRAPIVTSISTASATSVAQGDAMATMTVSGSYFKNMPSDPVVTISGADVTVNTLTFVTGGVSSQVDVELNVGAAAAIGFRDVTLTNADTQFSTLIGALEVTAPPPNLMTIDTPNGRRKETINVTLNGTDFQAGATVSFGAGIGVTAVDDTGAPTSLVATLAIAGNAAQGSRNVTVTNADGANSTINAAFDVLRAVPRVTNANPSVGSRGDTALDVDVLGADFDCSGGMQPTVDFNDVGVTVNMVTCPGTTEFETQVTANIDIGSPGAATGFHTVDVTNPSDTVTGTGAGVFNVLLERPTVASVMPSPQQGETRDVTVAGNFFQATPTVGTPQAGVTINSVTFVDPMTLTVNVTIDFSVPIGTYDITVTNPDGQLVTANMLAVVTAPPPTVLSAVPDKGTIGDTGLDVTIIGTGFQPGAGATTVSFGAGVTVNTVTVNSETSITANIDVVMTTGLRDITVTNPVGTVNTGVGMNLFRVTDTPPVITDINPNSGDVNTTLLGVEVNGSDFRAGATVDFGADVGVTVQTIAAAQILVDLDLNGSNIGFHSVTVTNSDTTTFTLTNGFEVTDPAGAPAIANVRIVRDSGGNLLRQYAGTMLAGRTHTLHIIGSNFGAAATVLISGPNLTLGAPVIDVGGTRIDIDVTVGCGDVEPSFRDVTVINTDGKNATLVGGVDVRNGVVMNEVVTRDRTNHACDGGGGREIIELYNSGGCDYDINNWRIDMIDNNATVYLTGDEIEHYSAGSSINNLQAGDYVMICRPDGGGDNMQNDIFLALYTNTGRFIDDLEIGDDRENDGNDGGPAVGNDGNNNDANNESVGRCPDGRDTANDVNDFYQDEAGGVEMASTDVPTSAPNNPECPVCSDGTDNDGDGWFDFDDPGCTGPNDADETDGGTTECNDGMDNGDADGLIDELDPDCFDGGDNDESI